MHGQTEGKLVIILLKLDGLSPNDAAEFRGSIAILFNFLYGVKKFCE
jgi:hypothetical protein